MAETLGRGPTPGGIITSGNVNEIAGDWGEYRCIAIPALHVAAIKVETPVDVQLADGQSVAHIDEGYIYRYDEDMQDEVPGLQALISDDFERLFEAV